MTKIALTKAPTGLLECAVYIFARKKLIHAMSLDTDRPINRSVVVGCAISATRNYLKLHMSRTLKVLLCNTHAETRKLWKPSAGLPPLEAIPVDQFTIAVHCCTSRACRDAHCTIFGSPVCRHGTSPRARVALTVESGAGIKSSSRPLLSRCPTSRDFVPWRFLDAGQLSARVFHRCRRPKTST